MFTTVTFYHARTCIYVLVASILTKFQRFPNAFWTFSDGVIYFVCHCFPTRTLITRRNVFIPTWYINLVHLDTVFKMAFLKRKSC